MKPSCRLLCAFRPCALGVALTAQWVPGAYAQASSQLPLWEIGVFDIADSLKDKGLSLEPEHIFERSTGGGSRYGTSVGLVFGDERLTNTFYGFAPADATAARPTYSAHSGLIMSRLSLNLSQGLTPNLRVFGFTRINSVEGAANAASPLLRLNTGSTLGCCTPFPGLTRARRTDLLRVGGRARIETKSVEVANI